MKVVPITLAALVLGGGAYAWYRVSNAKPVGKTTYTVSPAMRGTVKKTVSASGTLEAWTTVDVKSKAGGRIDLLAVDIGSRVKSGQILARIDPTDSMLTYSQAKASTESATAKVSQSAETYQLTVAQSAIAVDQARANLASAQANLLQAQARLQTARTENTAQPSLTNAAIAQAKAAYDAAVQSRKKLDSTQTQDLASAQSAYDQAVANDKNAQTNLARQKSLADRGFVSQSTVDTAAANASVTQANVDAAKSKLDTLGAQQRAERDSSDAAVRQAAAAYKTATTNGFTINSKQNALAESLAAVQQQRAAVLTAQAQLSDAQAALRNGAIRKLDVNVAQASTASAKASLVNAKATLDQTVVTAPTDGVVLQKYAEQGTIITSGLSLNSSGTSIVQIGDVSRMYVDVAVDETDIASIHIGEKVDVAFDAFPDREFSGKVTKINPMGVVESNVTTIHVRVEVDNTAEGFSELKPEMNATCDFIESEKTDVFNVPSEAIHEENGESYVEVAVGGKPVKRDDMPAMPSGPPPGGFPAGGPDGGPGGEMPPMPEGMPKPQNIQFTVTDVKVERRKVTTGLVGNETTEIVSGLQERDLVIVSKEEPKGDEAPAARAAFGGGGPGGPPMGGRR